MKIFFASKNIHKYEELKNIIKESSHPDLELIFHDKTTIRELQIEDPEKLVREKVLEAFKAIQRPVLVEHTALDIHAFNHLPGLQTKHFYDKLDAQGIIDYCGYKKNFEAEAISWLGYCNGEKIEIVKGNLNGLIVEKLQTGENGFEWDNIFIPNIPENPDKKTLSELGEEKNNISMRKKAWEELEEIIPERTSQEEIDEKYQKAVEELARLINENKVMLFLGAGISASMNLPDWDKLLGELGKDFGYDADVFKTYGDYMVLAEYAKKKKREEWKTFFQNKFDLSKLPDYQKDLKNNEIYQIISELNFPVIYTTNYDHILEDYFQMNNIPFKSVVQIGDMNEISPRDIRVIKFHGDSNSSETKVLSESEYFERMDFQDFRDIQLQADLLQYHVFFLGYSLSDINVRLILYRTSNRWKKQGAEKKAYIFSVTPNQIRAEVFLQNNIITINGEHADKKEGTLQFLRDLKNATKNLQKVETGGNG